MSIVLDSQKPMRWNQYDHLAILRHVARDLVVGRIQGLDERQGSTRRIKTGPVPLLPGARSFSKIVFIAIGSNQQFRVQIFSHVELVSDTTTVNE